MAEAADAPALWKGALAGLAAGLAASLAMDGFQALIAALAPSDDDSEPATEQAADKLSTVVAGQPVPDAAKPAAGQAMHYALGATLGVAYGVAAEAQPAVARGGGALFGLTTAALLDETAVPATGLGPAPWRTPPATHAYTLASHLVFGTSAELSRRLVRRLIG